MSNISFGRKMGVAAAMLSAALTTALVFRKDASHVEQTSSADGQTEFVERVTRRLTASSNLRPPRTHLPFRLVPQPASALPAATGMPSDPAPSIPQHYPRELSPVGALLRPMDQDKAAADDDDAPQLNPATGAQDNERTHTIVDGDTLTRLAIEYLGSGDRYLEIYAFNTDVLSSPDLLPIGRTLRIPPRERPATVANDPAQEEAEEAAQPRLVPIPPGALRRASE